jgi:hypothetical protein
MAFVDSQKIITREIGKNGIKNTSKISDMKWTDEDIDKMAQDAAGKVNVPYSDSYWAEMDAMLDVNSPVTSAVKSKKKGFWWMFGVLFALIGFAISFSLINSKNDSYEKRMQANLNDSQDTNSRIFQEIPVEQKTSDIEDGSEPNQKKEIQSKNSNQGIAENEIDFESVVLSNKLNSIERIQSSESISKSAPSETRKQTSSAGIIMTSDIESSNKPRADFDISVDKKTSPADLKVDVTSTQPKQNTNDVAFQESNPENGTNEFVIEQEGSVLNQKDKDEKRRLDSEKLVVDSLLALKAKNDSIDNLAKVMVDTAKQSNLKNASDNLNEIQKLIQQPVPTRSYYIQAGMRFSQSYLKTANNRMMNGINLGFGYQQIKPGFGYSLGLHLTSSFVQNMEINRKSRVYGFSVVNYQQDLIYKQLTYVELPISLNFIQSRNTFSIGISPTYLASSMMRFTERQDLTITNEHTYYGQKVGFKSVGLDATFGYQRAIRNNWSVGIQLGVALIQQVEKNQFEQESVSFPVYGQITLRKMLIPKK